MLSQLLKLTAFGTIPRWSWVKIFYEMVQTSALQCAAPVMSRALFCLLVLTCPSHIYSIPCISRLFTWHDCLSKHPNVSRLHFWRDLDACWCFCSHFGEQKLVKAQVNVCAEWIKRPNIARSWIFLRLHSHLLKRFPSTDGDYHLQNHQTGACWFVHGSRMLPAITVCCKMTELPRKGTKSWAEETQK